MPRQWLAGGSLLARMEVSSAAKATLRILALCFVLLLLVAAVTVAVALLARHAESARRLQACQERAANETAALANRVAQLEGERAQRAKELEKLARREKDLQRQLGLAKEGRKRLDATLTGCLENVVREEGRLGQFDRLHLPREVPLWLYPGNRGVFFAYRLPVCEPWFPHGSIPAPPEYCEGRREMPTSFFVVAGNQSW